MIRQTEAEQVHAKMLASFIAEAIYIRTEYGIADCKEIKYIRSLWNNESFDDIVRKYNKDGSYSWWMTGVHALMNK